MEKLIFWRKVSNITTFTGGALLVVDLFFIEHILSNIFVGIMSAVLVATFLIAELMKVIVKKKLGR